MADDVPGSHESPTELRKQLGQLRDEIADLRLSLDVLSTIDLASGLLNRNGLLESIQSALNWLRRRNEPFGLMGIRVPELARQSDDELVRHLGAVLSSTLRAVDSAAVLEEVNLVGVLRELTLEGIPQVVARVREALGGATRATPITPRFVVVLVRRPPSLLPADLIERLTELLDEAPLVGIKAIDLSA